MIPLACRLLVGTASLIVPQRKRSEWRREWEAELWHRAEAGAPIEELLHHARGVFRDAYWFLQTERKTNGIDPFRKPLRTEAMALGVAVALCFCAGGWRKPTMPYRDAQRVVVFERNLAFAGQIDPRIRPSLFGVWEKGGDFESLAGYRTLREPEPALHVAANFFDVLGRGPMLGRTFRAAEPPESVILPYETWQDRMHGDPGAIGKVINIGRADRTVVGIMPQDFWFRSRKIQFYAPLRWPTFAAGVVARLAPGIGIDRAQKDVRQESMKVESKWVSQAFALASVVRDTRVDNLIFGLEIAGVAALLSMGFLIAKGLGRWRYWSLLGARVFMSVTALFFIRQALIGPSPSGLISTSLFVFWMFLLVCSAAVFLLVIDHRARCPVCLRKLRKPVSIGSYASQILDQPATEYLCPAGHGTLYVAETGNASDAWTKLDESWQEFFVHSD